MSKPLIKVAAPIVRVSANPRLTPTALWNAIKQQTCLRPATATCVVMLTEQAFRDAFNSLVDDPIREDS